MFSGGSEMSKFEALHHNKRVYFAKEADRLILVYALNSDGFYRYLTTLEGGNFDNYIAIKWEIVNLSAKPFTNLWRDNAPMLPSAFTEDWLYKDMKLPVWKK